LLTNGSGEVRITDGRVARLVRGHRAGTVRFANARYAAPEVILGHPPVPATDVYNLGLLLYELLADEPFVDGDDATAILLQHVRGRPVVLPEPVEAAQDILAACLAVDPAARLPADELVEALRSLRHRPPDAPPAPSHPAHHGSRPPSWPEGPVVAGPAVDDNADLPSGSVSRAPVVAVPRPATAGRVRRWSVTRGLMVLLVVGIVVGGGAALVLKVGPVARRVPHAGTARDPASTGEATPEAAVLPPPSAATAAGATDFVRYWFDALNRATATGDTRPLEAISTPDCGPCKAVVAAVRSAHDGGDAVRGGQYTVRSLVADGFFTPARPLVGVVFDRGARSLIGPDGRLIGSVPAATFARCQVLLRRTDDGWRVAEVLSDVPIA
jgi:hypothetical protein